MCALSVAPAGGRSVLRCVWSLERRRTRAGPAGHDCLPDLPVSEPAIQSALPGMRGSPFESYGRRDDADPRSNRPRLVAAAAVVTRSLLVRALSDSDEGSPDNNSTVPGEATALSNPGEVSQSSVSASSSISDGAFGPESLIDGSPTTYWNDASLQGEGAELVFEFADPVQTETIVIEGRPTRCPIGGTNGAGVTRSLPTTAPRQ